MKVTWRPVLAVALLVLMLLAVGFTPAVLRRLAFFRVRQMEIAGTRYAVTPHLKPG